jgi:hypothetical protein
MERGEEAKPCVGFYISMVVYVASSSGSRGGHDCLRILWLIGLTFETPKWNLNNLQGQEATLEATRLNLCLLAAKWRVLNGVNTTDDGGSIPVERTLVDVVDGTLTLR